MRKTPPGALPEDVISCAGSRNGSAWKKSTSVIPHASFFVICKERAQGRKSPPPPLSTLLELWYNDKHKETNRKLRRRISSLMKYAIDFAILLLLYIFYFYKRWRAQGKEIVFIRTTMYVYLAFVLYFTLMPITTSLPFILNHPYVPMNMVPFIDVLEGRGDFFRQIALNVLMTIPFGILLPMNTKKNFPTVVIYAFLMSLSIELLQPLINGARSSDVTDIITNVLGAVIGYVIYLPIKPRLKKLNK